MTSSIGIIFWFNLSVLLTTMKDWRDAQIVVQFFLWYVCSASLLDNFVFIRHWCIFCGKEYHSSVLKMLFTICDHKLTHE